MYRCLKNNTISIEDYLLIPIRGKDIYIIKKWRNEQIKILRQQKRLTNQDQKRYFESVIFPLFKKKYPEQILFSFLKKEKLIGYGGLVHISWEDKRVEISFLLDTSRLRKNKTYENDFTFYLKLIKKVAFEDIGFNKIFTETFDIRPLHVKVLEKNGFSIEGRLRNHNLIDGKFVDSLFHGMLKKEYAQE
jgi:RimJ/RimL family protein N-acetyltransferase